MLYMGRCIWVSIMDMRSDLAWPEIKIDRVRHIEFRFQIPDAFYNGGDTTRILAPRWMAHSQLKAGKDKYKFKVKYPKTSKPKLNCKHNAITSANWKTMKMFKKIEKNGGIFRWVSALASPNFEDKLKMACFCVFGPWSKRAEWKGGVLNF